MHCIEFVNQINVRSLVNEDYSVKLKCPKETFLLCLILLFLFQVWGVSYNHDGNRVVSVSDDKNLLVYNIPV